MYKKALEILCAMTGLPFSFKTWRREISDLFQESKFFQNRPEVYQLWQTVVHSLIRGDLTELLSRITAIPSSSIFGSRESEVLQRTYSVKRLSFAIYSAPVDFYLQQLPLIQEKLVELLKGPIGLMHVEAYHCIRVLLFRITTKHLANFWPIVLTELYRLFSSLVEKRDELESLPVFYAACKLLDLMLVLGVEEFQWYAFNDDFC